MNQENTVNCHVWDLSGDNKYFGIIPQFLKDRIACLILVFDLSRKKTFENLDNWLKQIEDKLSPNSFIYLIGNKKDLEREVTNEEVSIFCSEKNIK